MLLDKVILLIYCFFPLPLTFCEEKKNYVSLFQNEAKNGEIKANEKPGKKPTTGQIDWILKPHLEAS